ncbi:hypothetical protein [Ramlibacter rhizophilus]|uniref:General stress protein 17M-like domain-containing protein n=1 Tax=Ramlibacter rhizophilus TaxID=1781167 RepID=A0A4Z0BRE9_9BURK|nr:hypothetical protein [Ramlibacter rhizophilus]TFZ01322.1 hypothetical protein EZ242_08035 [Ramlibacter rhizophilus]
MQAVIGAFDQRADAQRALDRLVEAGIARSDIHLEQHEAELASGNRGLDESAPRRKGIAGFLASIFTSEDQANTGHAHTYEEAARRGSTVLVVHARDERQAELAASVLHESDAVDVDERSRQWAAEGWSGSAAGGSHPLDRGGVRVLPRRP